MEKLRFSYSGAYLAVACLDGRLRIWETDTNKLKHEFTPTAHLNASGTCIEWSPVKEGRKKKRKKTIKDEIVAMGTAAGCLIFYDVAQAELAAQSKEAHSGKVNALAWNPITHALFSCSEDGYIFEWDVENCDVIRRWKGTNKGGVTSLQIFNDKLLSASQGITLWDLKTKTSIATFSGHQNQVIQMESIPETSYFVTMGRGERFLKIWSTTEQNSIATLLVPEVPNFFSLTTKAGTVSVSIVAQKGDLHIFQHKLNGPIHKPISACGTLKINESSNPKKLISILASYLPPDEEDNPTIITAYGSWTKLCFESFSISKIQNQTIVEREFTLTSKKSIPKSAQKKMVQVPADVKHLQPGIEEIPIAFDKAGAKKRISPHAVNVVEDGELPMEERLTNLTITSTAPGIRENNLAHLLSQGLHSQDVRILQSVFSRWDEDIITNTVRSLPVQLVIPLLNETKKLLAGKGQMNHNVLKWIKIVLQVHSSYIMCCPSTEEMLGPFMSLLRTREVIYPQMCQLKGKLQLIKSHIDAKKCRSEPTNEALLVFNDESDGENEENLIPSDSEVLSSDDLGVEDSEEEDMDEGESLESDAESSKSETIEKSHTPSKDSNHLGKKANNAEVSESESINDDG